MTADIKCYIKGAHRRREAPAEIQAFARAHYGVTLKMQEIYSMFAEMDEAADGKMRCVCGYAGNGFTRLHFSTHPDSGSDHGHDIAVREQAEEVVIFACPVCGTLKINV